ncbi:MAG: NUDIX domain-containing protein [Eubacterium sp.]
MNTENTNWQQSVTGVLIKDNKVLLARHTYGAGKNLLIVPGGYVNFGETPQQAVVREYMEETGVTVVPKDIIAIRFNLKDWYVAFAVDYVSGDATTDNDENSEVIWLDIDEALQREDVPDLTKKLIQSAINSNHALTEKYYFSREQHGTYSLYSK